MGHRIKLWAAVIVLVLPWVSAATSFRGDELPKMYLVHLPIQSYRLLAMAMDEDGDIWFGSIHHVIHRYTPSTGAVETIPLPQDAAEYKNLWASQSLPANGKVYILSMAYPRLMIYDRAARRFTEKAYPSPKPDVWYGLPQPDGRHLYLFDRGSVGIIKWDTKTDTGTVIPYPYKTLMPSFGQYDQRDKAVWCGIWDYTGGQYRPIGIARLDTRSDSFTGIWYFPKDDAGLQPYTDPDNTRFYPWTLKGKLMPFDIKTKRWCKFIDVPEYGKRFGFIGFNTPYNGKLYFSLSTYNGGEDLGIDGQQYHFANSIFVFDPRERKFDFLTLDVPGAFYQIAYTLNARGQFYATGSNILTKEGKIFRENRGDIIVWQTQPARMTAPVNKQRNK